MMTVSVMQAAEEDPMAAAAAAALLLLLLPVRGRAPRPLERLASGAKDL
jgi:hypothetical protein